jgi:hypothetical protein
MKDIIKIGIYVVYAICLSISVFYSIVNPLDTLEFLRSGSGDPITAITSSILASSWVLILIVAIWMVVDMKRGTNK